MSLFKKLGLSDYGFNQLDDIYHNLSLERLTEETVINGEGVIGLRGATMGDTGEFTGRSPKDKYFVNESSSSGNIWWGDVNQKIDNEVFQLLFNQVIDFYMNSNVFEKLIIDLSDNNFKGILAPHHYGEPLSDGSLYSKLDFI